MDKASERGDNGFRVFELAAVENHKDMDCYWSCQRPLRARGGAHTRLSFHNLNRTFLQNQREELNACTQRIHEH